MGLVALVLRVQSGRGHEFLGRSGFLDDDDVRRWYNNVRQGSKITADHCLSRLGRVCSMFNVTPDAVAYMSSREAYTFLLDVVTGLQERGRVGANINNSVKAVKSWLGYNEVNVTGRIAIAKSSFISRFIDSSIA